MKWILKHGYKNNILALSGWQFERPKPTLRNKKTKLLNSGRCKIFINNPILNNKVTKKRIGYLKYSSEDI